MSLIFTGCLILLALCQTKLSLLKENFYGIEVLHFFFFFFHFLKKYFLPKDWKWFMFLSKVSRVWDELIDGYLRRNKTKQNKFGSYCKLKLTYFILLDTYSFVLIFCLNLWDEILFLLNIDSFGLIWILFVFLTTVFQLLYSALLSKLLNKTLTFSFYSGGFSEDLGWRFCLQHKYNSKMVPDLTLFSLSMYRS